VRAPPALLNSWFRVGYVSKPYLPPEEEAREGAARLAEQRHRQRLGHDPQRLPQVRHRMDGRVGAGREAAAENDEPLSEGAYCGSSAYLVTQPGRLQDIPEWGQCSSAPLRWCCSCS
jgi:hypothetical protein